MNSTERFILALRGDQTRLRDSFQTGSLRWAMIELGIPTKRMMSTNVCDSRCKVKFNSVMLEYFPV